MIRLPLILIALVAGVGLAHHAFQDSDYVVIGFGEWVVQTSLTVFVVLLALAFVPAYWSVRFFAAAWRSPSSIAHWRQRRRTRRAQELLSIGLTALAEGRWTAAERRLVQSADRGASPLLAFLGAARAAQELGRHEGRDLYLRLANQDRSTSTVAVGLAQAELQIDEAQREQALATLLQLRSQAPNHPQILGLLRSLYEELEDWKSLLELIPSLRRHRLLDKVRANDVEVRALSGLLAEAAADDDPGALERRWESLSKSKRLNPALLGVYSELMLERGKSAECEALLRAALDKGWDDNLVHLYGRVEAKDPVAQLRSAEAWLPAYREDATLLLTLGRLCARNRLWGKARSYFDASITVEPRPETYKALSDLLSRLGESEAATRFARLGLALAVHGADAGDLENGKLLGVAGHGVPDGAVAALAPPSSPTSGP